MKKKKNHYPDCEINNGGECDCDGNYDPKNQKSWEEKWVDIIREWHKDDPYPPIRPLVKRISQELIRERKRIVEEINLTRWAERAGIKRHYGKDYEKYVLFIGDPEREPWVLKLLSKMAKLKSLEEEKE